jgi:hypothetical protein
MNTAVFAALLFALPFTIGAATAQPFPFNEAGVTNGPLAPQFEGRGVHY